MPSSSLVAAIIVGSLASASAGFTCESVDAVCRDCGDGCNLISKLTDITDEDECCAACVDEPQCISWTLNHYSQECHLKDAVAEASDGNCTSGGSAGVNRPHILLITSDQQRTDTVSAYHNDRGVSGGGLTSPNFDRLAAQGVRWTEALVTSPVCSPCRTSLLTGVHVPVHKVVENSVAPYPDDLSVYPDVLESQGYTSYMIGKVSRAVCRSMLAVRCLRKLPPRLHTFTPTSPRPPPRYSTHPRRISPRSRRRSPWSTRTRETRTCVATPTRTRRTTALASTTTRPTFSRRSLRWISYPASIMPRRPEPAQPYSSPTLILTWPLSNPHL